jgi:hypothetical protein
MREPKMKAMQGMTVLGMLFTAFIIIVVVVLAINLIPPYLNNHAIRESMESLAKDPEISKWGKPKLRDMFIRKLQVNDIKNVPPELLVIEEKDKKHYLTINYEVRTHLLFNIDAVIKFNEQVMIE